MALAMLKRSVKKRAGFSVDAVAPLDAVGNAFVPALFGARRLAAAAGASRHCSAVHARTLPACLSHGCLL